MCCCSRRYVTHAPLAITLYYIIGAHAYSAFRLAEKAMEQLTLQPIKRIEGHVQLPGSKSLSNRVLLLAALSEGTTLVKNLLVSHFLPLKVGWSLTNQLRNLQPCR